MIRNLLFVMMCFVGVIHNQVQGKETENIEVAVRNAPLKFIFLKFLSIAICPLVRIYEDTDEDPALDENLNGDINKRAFWCGTNVKVGGLCNTKCTSSFKEGFLACLKALKNGIFKVLKKILKALCKIANSK